MCFTTLFCSISLLLGVTEAATASEWRKRTIYQIVTDRFALDNNTGTNVTCDTSLRAYCGGSWRGVIKQLDYIQQLGFDAVWISPTAENVEVSEATTSSAGEAYLGYWTSNRTSTNAHFGFAEDLAALSDALHARNMFLMLDITVNNLATIVPPNSSTPPRASVSANGAQQFHPLCAISDQSNQTEVEQCWLPADGVQRDLDGSENATAGVWFPDVNTEDVLVVKAVLDEAKAAIKASGADGVRIGSVKHVRQDFWPDFRDAVGVFMLGENGKQVVSDSVNYVDPYTAPGIMDAVFDYPTYYELKSAFSSSSGNLSALVDIVTEAQKSYEAGLMLTASFIENHDLPRFANATNDTALIMNAMAWPFIHDGIPVLYYGQEQGFKGGAQPENHEPLWPSQYANTPYAQVVRALNAARKSATAVNHFFLTTPMTFIDQSSPGLLAISKPPLLALLTNGGSNTPAGSSWTAKRVYTANETLVDVLSCRRFVADANGGVEVPVVGGMPQILLPTAALDKNGTVCPGEGTGHDLLKSVSASPIRGHEYWWLRLGIVAVTMTWIQSSL
ncbi:hypothetical protein HWV62_28519 [Athelia sp. TMB]|nr:hypothetical protein HWV62_28519 [Athelia sp. TMB]